MNNEIANFLISAIRQFVNSFEPILDIFPSMRILPVYRTKLQNLASLKEKLIPFLKDMIFECSNKAGNDNFVKEFIKKAGADYSEAELIYVLKDLMAAGSETGASQLSWAIVLLCNEADLQRRLVAEIDSVVKRDRYPSLDDTSALPLLEATLLEIFRFKTIVPLSVPHTTLRDTQVAGYRIPKDSMVLVNLYSAHMDESVWKDPHIFRPERFLGDNGQVVNRDLMITFSLGKRSCLGEILARQELFIFVAGLLQHFEILPPDGEASVPTDMRLASVMIPKPYKVRFVPRAAN
jgi:cytochrome P450